MEEQLSLDTLVPELLSRVRQYGIKEVSMEQYIAVCSNLQKYAAEEGINKYSKELLDAFTEHEDNRCRKNEICVAYNRFIHRVLRLLGMLADTGEIDFSPASNYTGQCKVLMVVTTEKRV